MNKKVKLNLVGLDGNAFSLMGAWQSRAKKEGWTKDEMKVVLDDAMCGDYNHLVATLADHCTMGEESDE